jgi:hypothetical protein
MKKDLIFIHVPKTGGTSLIAELEGQKWQIEPNFNYRHIHPKTKTSNSADIFDPRNFDKFREYKIFMMLRHPVDRAISEYYFIRGREEFFAKFQKKPANFAEYAANPQTWNYVVSFLLGKPMYALQRPVRQDLDQVLRAVDELPIHVGIFEHFPESMQYFADITGVEWSRKMEAKRMTFSRPKAEELSEDLRDLILEKNNLDLELYKHCLEKFSLKMNELGKSRITFIKDRYLHVAPYMERYCLFEFCLENKQYLRQNFNFFRDLSNMLIQKERITDGRQLVQIWNASFLNAVSHHFPGSEFYLTLSKDFSHGRDPLEQLQLTAAAIDQFFSDHAVERDKYYRPMKFDKGLVVVPRVGLKGILRMFWG